MFALNIASKRQGSKLVICTDGKKLKYLFYWIINYEYFFYRLS
jgi:hypothetical protein